MNILIKDMSIQIEKIIQSNKIFRSVIGEKQRKISGIILTSNIVKLEKIIKEVLHELELIGVDIDKARGKLTHESV